MSTGFTKRALSLILAICMVMSAFTVTAFAAGNWSPGTTTKIYVDATAVSQFEALEYEANFFEAEYEKKIGDINTAIGAVSDAGSTDIVLTYDASVPTQGFNVSVSGDRLIVAASDDDGIFYGWRYVIQQLLINGSVSAASQSPSVLERSVSLDNGRKYYSVEWIKELIREMSWSNMNTLVMHFSEEMGLGLETKLYPWLNGRDGRLCTQATLSENFDDRYRYLTQADLTAAVNAIASAKAALATDSQALTAAVAEADSITEGMYSDASYAAYLEAVEVGRAVLANADATPAEVSAALEAILTAKSKLTSDKSALKTALDYAPSLKDVDTTQFTQEVLDRYTAALANAEAVLENSGATQPEVDAALAELLEAKKAIFVDLTALEAAVALAPNVVARKDLIVGAFYNDYMYLVEEAKNEYLSGHISDQNAVDAMTDALMTSYERLMSGQHDKAAVLKNLPELIARHDELAVYNENPMTAFVFEGWLLYHTAVMNAKDLIASDAYDHASVDAAISEIKETSEIIEMAMIRIPGMIYPNAEGPTITEAMVPRKDMINSAGFQVKSVYSGRTARMAINTIKSFNVQEVIIIGEDGLEVPANITVAPVNRRKPNQKILYADIVLDLEPGTYTFTVYVRETNSQGNIEVICSKPVTCTITVR